MSKFEVHYQHNDAPQSAISLLQSQTSLSVADLKSAISKGALWLEKGKSVQRLRRFKKPINSGETLHFYYNSEVLAQTPAQAILIDDQTDYSVWYKPSGMMSQGSKWSDHCTITRWAQTHLPNDRACFLVHRLDRATSGLILIAHSKNSARQFSKLFEQHQLTKCYHAIVQTNGSTQEKMTVTQPIDNKPATSHFLLLNQNNALQLAHYQVCIETGRKHQIRKHAQYLNMPIIGDRLYNADESKNTLTDLQLCAVKLAFKCPISQQDKNYLLPDSLSLCFKDLCKQVKLKTS